MSLCIVTHKGRYYYITRTHYFISIHIVFWDFISLSSDLTQVNMASSHIFFRYKQCTVEPQYNKGPRDWQNMFATMRFLVKRFFSVYFSIIGKLIIPKFIIPKSSLYRGLLHQGVTTVDCSPSMFTSWYSHCQR